MTKKKLSWIILAAVLLSAAGGAIFLNSKEQASQTAQSTQSLQTSVAKNGNLTLVATGTGSIWSQAGFCSLTAVCEASEG